MPTLMAVRLGACIAVATGTASLAHADDMDCVHYATDYANAHIGSGDINGDAVSAGMAGAVAGGALNGARGARRSARAAAAVSVLDNLGSLPGGWQALYDMAYGMCLQRGSGAHVEPYAPGAGYGTSYGTSSSGCRSSASVNAPPRLTPEGGIMAGSGLNGCR